MVLQHEGDPGVRRRRLIEEWSNSEGALTGGGGDGGDARTESSTKKGLRWRKTGEVDVWATGDECAALRRGQTRQTTSGEGKKIFSRPAATLF
jgi:hypothetical protein